MPATKPDLVRFTIGNQCNVNFPSAGGKGAHMMYTVHIQRGGPDGPIVRSGRFGTLQEAQSFATTQWVRLAADFAAIVETDDSGKEVRNYRIDHFDA